MPTTVTPLSAGGAASPLWMGGVATYVGTTDTAAQAFDRVLNYMGANWWTRDGVIDTPDERIINEARTGTGKIMAWADDPWNNDPAEGVGVADAEEHAANRSGGRLGYRGQRRLRRGRRDAHLLGVAPRPRPECSRRRGRLRQRRIHESGRIPQRRRRLAGSRTRLSSTTRTATVDLPTFSIGMQIPTPLWSILGSRRGTTRR